MFAQLTEELLDLTVEEKGYRHALYALSEHVVAPYSYAQVLANLDRMMRRLVLVEPNAQSKT